MRVCEIGHAAHMVDVHLNINDAQMITTKDGEDIWAVTVNGLTAWFTKNKDIPSAYIITSAHPQHKKFHRLYRLMNREAQKGTISMLVSVVVDSYYPLFIDSEEDLTDEGFRWLVRAIKTGLRGRKITDQTNNKPDIEKLTQEWLTAFDTGERGTTQIFIEGKIPKKQIQHPFLGILTEFVGDSKETI